ncbi:uncharacterized protein [Rutidosis leptorrhynchoides]|uniref:uncharacterized protein n=1 Tax=Rutidosis leptorrhynchoides TaxID=125765 RepID=UPI003A99F3DD
MERQDWNMIGADCVVISCCCQCLMLQLLVFVLLKLPRKMIKKTKQYMKRKFGKRMRDDGKIVRTKMARCAEEVGCMEEVEEVLEELCTKGEFGFGSFWRGDVDSVEVHFPICKLTTLLSIS